MKVFITGATGYIGNRLSLILAQENFKVIALVRNLKSQKLPNHENIVFVEGDIVNFDAVFHAMKGCSYVFHTAAYTNLNSKNIDDFYNVNVLGTENILKAALQHRIRKVIYTSTLAVYGPSYKNIPITESQPRITSYANDYELTKSMSEELIAEYTKKGLSCSILNVTRVYGPSIKSFSSGVNTIIEKIMKKDFLIVPSKLDIITNYVFIDDVIKANILAMKKTTNGKYIIGGHNLSYTALFDTIKKHANSNIRIVKINYSLVKTLLSITAFFKNVFGISGGTEPKVLNALFVNRMSSSGKAITEIDYEITPIHIGLEKTINSLKFK